MRRLVSQLDVAHAAVIRRGGVSAFVQERSTPPAMILISHKATSFAANE
jgi:hypothetical protein